MVLTTNIPQLLCLAVILFLTLPRKVAGVLSVVAVLFVYHEIFGGLINLYLLGLAVFKGLCIYRKQSQMPSVMTVVTTIALTAVLLVVIVYFRLPGAHPLLISLLLVLLYPKVTTYFRDNPVNLSILMNKRMLASLLVFAITFQLIDIATPESLFAEEDSSVLLVWLLSISGILAYGLALNRIPALIVSAVFYLIGVMYLTELFALRSYFAEFKRFNDVFDIFSPWLLAALAVNLISLVCIAVYTWGYQPNPLPASAVWAQFGDMSRLQEKSASGLQSAKAFAQTHQLDTKFAQASSQIKQHLNETNYPGQFQQYLNRLKAAYQLDPKGVKVKVAVVTVGVFLLIWMIF